jgi:hypothetical protein
LQKTSNFPGLFFHVAKSKLPDLLRRSVSGAAIFPRRTATVIENHKRHEG